MNLFLLTITIRLTIAYCMSAPNNDINNYINMVQAHRMGKWPYEFHAIYPYVPFSIPMPVFAMWLSDMLHIPFYLTIKIYGILGDAFVTYFLLKLKVSERSVLLGWVLNPLSIWITSMHGNILSCTLPFVMGGWYILTKIKGMKWECLEAQTKFVFAFLLFGIAIAIRYWPALLIPVFLIYLKLKPREYMTAFMCLGLPSLISFVPLVADPNAPWDIIKTEVFGYRSTPDLSWLGMLRAAWYSYDKNIWLPGTMTETGMSIGMYLFCASWITFLAWIPFAYKKEYSMVKIVCIPLLLYFLFAGGVAAQYLVLIVPLLLTWSLQYAIVYSVIAWIAIGLFYIAWHPEIFWGAWSAPLIQPITNLQAAIDQHILMQSQVLALFALLCYTSFLLYQGLRRGERNV